MRSINFPCRTFPDEKNQYAPFLVRQRGILVEIESAVQICSAIEGINVLEKSYDKLKLLEFFSESGQSRGSSPQ